MFRFIQIFGLLLITGCWSSPVEKDEGGVTFKLSIEASEGQNLEAVTKESGAVLIQRMKSMGTELGRVLSTEPGSLDVYVPSKLLSGSDSGNLFATVRLSVWEVAELDPVPTQWQQALVVANQVVGQTTLEEMAAALKTTEPPIGDLHVAWEVPSMPGESLRLVPLNGTPIFTNAEVKSAHYAPDEMQGGAPIVHLTLTDAGAKAFGDATARLVDHTLAFVVNETVVMAPVVREAIPGGRVQISMGMNSTLHVRDAKVLAAALATPPLPGKLTILSAEEAQDGGHLNSTKP